jgi:DNA polymerase III delta prime subunit
MRAHLCEVFEKTPQELGLQPPQAAEPLPSPLPRQEEGSSQHKSGDENRQRMLKRIRRTWIEGVLEQSLHQAARIALDLQEQPDALENPWHLEIQETNRPPRPLPAGTTISEVYEQADGELLILGKPGAGKTTLLLELARDLLDRAEDDPAHCIPIIFNLASWGTKQPPLAEWLVEELSTKYRVPLKVGQQWIEANQLILLLDGLDEVAEGARPACVKAITTYQHRHPYVSLVVCCRAEEYFTQTTRFSLQQAVLIRPLTTQQVSKYLTSAGMQLETVRQALAEDPALQEMIKTPFMLSIVTLAYQGEIRTTLLTTGSIEARRKQVFTTYIQRMLDHRRANTRYSAQQTLQYLAWLAHHMQERHQTEFYLERIQPDCLEDHKQHYYQQTVLRIVFGLSSLISSGIYACFRGDSEPNKPGLFYWLGGGKGNSILGWMASGMGGGFKGGGSLELLTAIVNVIIFLIVWSKGIPPLSLNSLRRGLLTGLRNGVIFGSSGGILSGIIFSAQGGITYGVYRGIGTGILEGLIIGLTTALIAGLRYEQEQNSQHQQRQTPNLAKRLINFCFFGLCGFCGMSGIYAWESGGMNQYAMIYGLVVGLIDGLVLGLGNLTDLLPEIGVSIQPAEVVAWSWSNLGRNLAANLSRGFSIGLAIMIPTIVTLGCTSGFSYGIAYGVRYGLIYGVMIGAITATATILSGMLNDGWSSDMLADDQRLRPNEGIHKSIRNAFFASGLFGPIGGIIGGLISGICFWLGNIPGWSVLLLGYTLIYSIMFGFWFWLAFGGHAFIAHYVLRWYLQRSDNLSWNTIHFLDYAAERILLRKVGGGYIFSHHLLLDYCASLANRSNGRGNAEKREKRREERKECNHL